jgi:hypothetical protein
MASATDMSTPVTRGELKEELEQFRHELRHELRQELQELRGEIRHEFATKVELEIWGGALLARITASQQQLQLDLARHTEAIREWISTMISVIDEKYVDLPSRVSRLENAVFAPEQR